MSHRESSRPQGRLIPAALVPALIGAALGLCVGGGAFGLSLREDTGPSPYLTPLAVALHGVAVGLAIGIVVELINWMVRSGPTWVEQLGNEARGRVGLRHSAERERDAIRREAAGHAGAIGERFGAYAVFGWMVAILWLVAGLTYAAASPEAAARQRPGGLLLTGLVEGGGVMVGALALWWLWRRKLRGWEEEAARSARDETPVRQDHAVLSAVDSVVGDDMPPPPPPPSPVPTLPPTPPPPTKRPVRYRPLPGAPAAPPPLDFGEL